MRRETYCESVTNNDTAAEPLSNKDDMDFLLIQALSFSVLLNDIMCDKIHNAPNNEHEKGVRDGMLYLSNHIEDLLREYYNTAV